MGRAPLAEGVDVDAAVERARAALGNPLPAWRRAEVLDAAAHEISADAEVLARTIAGEAAKPLRTARVEVQRAVSTLTFSALAARTLAGDVVPMDASEAGDGKLAFTLRLPVGVVAGVTSFNFPLNLVCHKVGPAIAAGAPIVLKPAEQTPLSALMLRSILVDRCGLPPALFQVVVGPGETIGRQLVDHPDVAMVTFTGSPEVGWHIRATNPRKKVSLELGNNSPVILHEDADWATAARKIRVAGFSHAGQSCVSTQRIYVHRSVADAFSEALVEEVGAITVGDPLDEATEVSSLITADETARVASWVEEAQHQGASVLVGGSLTGTIYRPTVLRAVRPEMKVASHEVFGPVVGISVYDDLDQAIRLANDTRYGLQAAIWTNRLDVAMRAAHCLDFGGVLVNEVPTFRADQQPYGGIRDSGNTREGPQWAVREMTEERLVVLST